MEYPEATLNKSTLNKVTKIVALLFVFIVFSFYSLPQGMKNDESQDSQVIPNPITSDPTVAPEPVEKPHDSVTSTNAQVLKSSGKDTLGITIHVPSATPEDLNDCLRWLKDVIDEEDPRLNAIDAFIQCGVNPNEKGDKYSPVILAASYWMLPALKRMHKLKGIDFSLNSDIINRVGSFSPTSDLQRRQAAATIKFLLSIGGSIEYGEELMFAVRYHNVEIAKILLDNGANPNGSIPEFQFIENPLILAVRKKNFQLVKLLVERGAIVMAHNKFGISALHEAAAVDFLKALQFFIEECSCDPNALVPQLCDEGMTESEKESFWPGSSLLHLATMNGQLFAVQYLIEERNVKQNVRDKNGHIASFYASIKNIPEFDELKEKDKLRIRKIARLFADARSKDQTSQANKIDVN